MNASADARGVASEAALEKTGAKTRVRVPSGLLARIAIVLGILALALSLLFVVLIFAVTGLRDRSFDARHSEQVIATANGLQTLVIDFETGLRGYAITHDKKLLRPWKK